MRARFTLPLVDVSVSKDPGVADGLDVPDAEPGVGRQHDGAPASHTDGAGTCVQDCRVRLSSNNRVLDHLTGHEHVNLSADTCRSMSVCVILYYTPIRYNVSGFTCFTV